MSVVQNEKSGKYLNVFTDFGFKKLFGQEAGKQCLMDFFNAVLHRDDDPIADLSFRSTEHLGRSELDRRAVFDLYCVTSKEERIIIELQKGKQRHFKDRSLYYSTFPIQEQAIRGDWDFKLAPVFTVAILDFLLDDPSFENDAYHHVVRLVNTETKRVFSDRLTLVYLEMPKFQKSEAELVTREEKWAYILNNLDALETVPRGFDEEVFMQFLDTAELARLEPDERFAYEQSLKVYRDNKNVMDYAIEEATEKGFEQGLLKGREEGREEHEARGIERGRKERDVQIARAMKAKEIDTATISEVTGLSVEEIENLS